MNKKQVNKETINSIKKALLKRKYFSIFLALFTLGVNIFAWFVFSTSANVGLDATIAAWDVHFSDSSGIESNTFVIDVTKMKPGMNNFNKSISVNNNSDVTADFIYEITSFKLLGQTFQINNQAGMLTYLRTNYPFSVNFTASKAVLNPSDQVQFDVSVVWPYENATSTYYKLDDAYSFDSTLPYYQKVSDTYTLADVTSSNFNSLKTGLYLEKDDADTYFGMKCHEYETNSGKPCLSVTLKLLVQQQNG